MNTTSKVLFLFFFILIGCDGIYAQNDNNDGGVRGDISRDFYSSPPDSMKVYMKAEIQPKFSGDINKYFSDNIQYPEQARKKNIQGTVFLSCIIEKNGSISSVRVLRSPDTCLNNEAKRLVAKMPKWSPGMQNGKPVRVSDIVRVPFKL